jgi:hypothetical protein
MKCQMIKMREAGVVLPKYALRDQPRQAGDLSILDVRDDGVNRSIKTARLVYQGFSGPRMELLYEPHIVWMNENRFTLQGFERVAHDGKVIEYAQSWLCDTGCEETAK